MESKLDEKIINLVSNSEEEKTNNSEKDNFVSNSEETKTAFCKEKRTVRSQRMV